MNLTSSLLRSTVLKDGGKNADGCAICQDDITPGCKSLQMPCHHSFHQDCLHRWLSEHNTCPVCRCEVESNCPRYNEANYNELKGKLDKVTGEQPGHCPRVTYFASKRHNSSPPPPSSLSLIFSLTNFHHLPWPFPTIEGSHTSPINSILALTQWCLCSEQPRGSVKD